MNFRLPQIGDKLVLNSKHRLTNPGDQGVVIPVNVILVITDYTRTGITVRVETDVTSEIQYWISRADLTARNFDDVPKEPS